ncbi:AN1-type zinc finger protein 1 [Cryptotrichosporon argae]
MSLLDVGRACAACDNVDFLPFVCPACTNTFCSAHIHTHACTAASTSSTPSSLGRLGRAKAPCPVVGCQRETIESVGGLGGGTGTGIARQVRCPACGGAFCVAHREQSSHGCTGPSLTDARHDALIAHQARGRETLAAHGIVPKPKIPMPAQRDTAKRPADVSPPSMPATQAATPGASATDLERVQGPALKPKRTKEDVLWDVHVRKVKSAAKPLIKGAKAIDVAQRRSVAWAVLDAARVAQWQKGTKSDKAEKAWVPLDMPAGRVFDLLFDLSRTPRPPNAAEVCKLLVLPSNPREPRASRQINLSLPLAGQCADGDAVVLVRGV